MGRDAPHIPVSCELSAIGAASAWQELTRRARTEPRESPVIPRPRGRVRSLVRWCGVLLSPAGILWGHSRLVHSSGSACQQACPGGRAGSPPHLGPGAWGRALCLEASAVQSLFPERRNLAWSKNSEGAFGQGGKEHPQDDEVARSRDTCVLVPLWATLGPGLVAAQGRHLPPWMLDKAWGEHVWAGLGQGHGDTEKAALPCVWRAPGRHGGAQSHASGPSPRCGSHFFSGNV